MAPGPGWRQWRPKEARAGGVYRLLVGRTRNVVHTPGLPTQAFPPCELTSTISIVITVHRSCAYSPKDLSFTTVPHHCFPPPSSRQGAIPPPRPEPEEIHDMHVAWCEGGTEAQKLERATQGPCMVRCAATCMLLPWYQAWQRRERSDNYWGAAPPPPLYPPDHEE